ncbi:hemagglutinin repeat-containing protein [Amantichitinum ursilacus]|uniref:Filamentous hemagglutinin n=1 Tax=Amantichitinum ursilacus TaxID=857265 RepID=A0A0N0GNV1_9NEIS|nr:hemagglutinin repeat-containing protein [Amantichitinum ursilacus]KPC53173.1 hypothetical protein WG78_08785 [Amantichitinum ursilacus]
MIDAASNLNAQFSADAWRNVSITTEAGSSISTKGNVTLNAGNDLNLRAGQTGTHLDEAPS